MMKSHLLRILFCVIALCITGVLYAEGGLWLPNQIEGKLYKLMKSEGMKLSADDIYSINQACISNAILSLSNDDATYTPFASASFISKDGLVLTNFHCVMSYIQNLSNKENDFIKYGCWTTSREQEHPLFNLQVNQLVRVTDVTKQVLAGTDSLSGIEFNNKMNANAREVQKTAVKGRGMSSKVYSLAGGGQYVMLEMRSFQDVRIVAAPPISIAKFGGDTDNWQWPRYSADFALLRVYADENQPSRYKKENTPYHPEAYLKISTEGVEEDDFVMVAGFPAMTRQYIPSFALDKIIFQNTQSENDIIKKKLDYYIKKKEEGGESYSHYNVLVSRINNVYLRNRGEISGVREANLVEIKSEEEKQLLEWIQSDDKRMQKYGVDFYNEMKENYEVLSALNYTKMMFEQIALNSVGMIPYAGKFEKLIGMYRQTKRKLEGAKKNEIKRLKGISKEFFRTFKIDDDREIMKLLLPLYIERVDSQFFSEELKKVAALSKEDMYNYIDSLYDNTLLRDYNHVEAFLDSIPSKGIDGLYNDPMYKLSIGFYYMHVSKVARLQQKLSSKNMEYYSKYMEAYWDMHKDELLSADANRTPRYSFGKVEGAIPSEGLYYTPFATLDGLMSRKRLFTGDDDFAIPSRFADLVEERDFSSGWNNEKPVCSFLASTHTTAGSSGSAVLNSRGQLVGLNFDRIWQGLASDYRFDKDKSRSIVIDIRYILWVLEKYSASSHVLDELDVK